MVIVPPNSGMKLTKLLSQIKAMKKQINENGVAFTVHRPTKVDRAFAERDEQFVRLPE